MEYIHFGAQLCNEILNVKEKHFFWYTDHPAKTGFILQSEAPKWLLSAPMQCSGEALGKLCPKEGRNG